VTIIKKKYAAKQISAMNEQELSLWPKSLILKIHVITGWVVPATELFNILTDQFKKKLVEDYGNMNTEEIEYAFRKSGTVIKDWGKEMNLNLIDQVLIPYLSERIEASRNEERMKNPPIQKILTDEDLLNISRRDIEIAYQQMRNGRVPVMLDSFAETMIIDGFIDNKDQRDLFFTYCLGQGRENIYVQE
jgi:hypothetical protein